MAMKSDKSAESSILTSASDHPLMNLKNGNPYHFNGISYNLNFSKSLKAFMFSSKVVNSALSGLYSIILGGAIKFLS